MTAVVLWLFLAVPWVGLQCVIVVSPGNTCLLSFHENIWTGDMQRVQSLARRRALSHLTWVCILTRVCRIKCSNREVQTVQVPLKLDGTLHYATPGGVCMVNIVPL